MQALVDMDDELELDSLRNVKPVQLIIVYQIQPLSYFFICVSMQAAAFMTRWSFSVHCLDAIKQLQ